MKKVWYILYPFLFYYAVMLIFVTLAQWIFGMDDSHFVLCQLIATILTIPFMLPLYRQGQGFAGMKRQPVGVTKERTVHVLWAVLITACISIAVNNIITMTGLPEMSTGYQKANAGFYGGNLITEVLCLAVFTPVLEELVFRGIIYGRLKTMIPKLAAILLSALIFAVVHTNIVQFLYAFLVGILLAILMDCAGNVYGAMAGHMAANLIAIVRTETHLLDFTVKGNLFSWIISVGLLAAGVFLLQWHWHRE